MMSLLSRALKTRCFKHMPGVARHAIRVRLPACCVPRPAANLAARSGAAGGDPHPQPADSGALIASVRPIAAEARGRLLTALHLPSTTRTG